MVLGEGTRRGENVSSSVENMEPTTTDARSGPGFMLSNQGCPPQQWLSEQYSSLHRPLWLYVKRMLSGRGDVASDIVQDAFAMLCRESWPEIESFAVAWLYRTCRNRAIDFCRREGRMTITQDSGNLATVSDRADSHPSEGMERTEKLAELRHQIAKLSDQQQEILRLRLQDGLSYKQIADVTGLTVTNVGYHLHQAIVSLRSRMS